MNAIDRLTEWQTGGSDKIDDMYTAGSKQFADDVIELLDQRDELLAALKAVHDEWREGYGLRCVDQCRAAIAKANGRT